MLPDLPGSHLYSIRSSLLRTRLAIHQPLADASGTSLRPLLLCQVTPCRLVVAALQHVASFSCLTNYTITSELPNNSPKLTWAWTVIEFISWHGCLLSLEAEGERLPIMDKLILLLSGRFAVVCVTQSLLCCGCNCLSHFHKVSPQVQEALSCRCIHQPQVRALQSAPIVLHLFIVHQASASIGLCG